MLPNFVVIGPPRCGTTWLHYNLRAHPDIFVPKAKELHYFDTHYELGIETYEAQFRDWSGQAAVGDITPSYLSGAYSSNQRIPEMMHRYLPDARLIAVFRNPVERAYSHYWNNVSQDPQNLALTFEQKIAQRPQILDEGRYADHVQRYLAHFEERQLLLLLYDDLKQDPLGFLRKIYRHLSVDEGFVSGIETLKRNAALGRGHLARSRLLWQTSRVFAKLGAVRAAEKLREANGRFALPPMEAATRRRLIELYRPSNERLAEIMGRDLSHWSEY